MADTDKFDPIVTAFNRMTTDQYALDRITELLSGNEWHSEMFDAIADILRDTGRTIDDYEPGDDDEAGDTDTHIKRDPGVRYIIVVRESPDRTVFHVEDTDVSVPGHPYILGTFINDYHGAETFAGHLNRHGAQVCRFCNLFIVRDQHGAFVDATGGDVCAKASADGSENVRHSALEYGEIVCQRCGHIFWEENTDADSDEFCSAECQRLWVVGTAGTL